MGKNNVYGCGGKFLTFNILLSNLFQQPRSTKTVLPLATFVHSRVNFITVQCNTEFCMGKNNVYGCGGKFLTFNILLSNLFQQPRSTKTVLPLATFVHSLNRSVTQEWEPFHTFSHHCIYTFSVK